MAHPEDAQEKLQRTRRDITSLTVAIGNLVAERTKYALVAGEVKQELGLEVLDESREQTVLDSLLAAQIDGLDEESAVQLTSTLTAIARRAQETQRSSQVLVPDSL